jgi:hypothetical protein
VKPDGCARERKRGATHSALLMSQSHKGKAELGDVGEMVESSGGSYLEIEEMIESSESGVDKSDS